MNSDKLKNNLIERENMSADERQICDLIGRLDKVDCPKDFDFRLKARIANADRKDFQPSVWQTLRYILPLTASVLLVAFLLIQAGMFSSPASQSDNSFAAAEKTQIQPSANQTFSTGAPTVAEFSDANISQNPVRQNDLIIPAANTKTIASAPQPRMRNAVLPNYPAGDEPTMSRDLGVRQNQRSIYPKGINPNAMPTPVKQEEESKPVSANEILDFVGIEAQTVDGKIVVKTVKEKSIAGNAGVKAGDAIEAIDDVKPDPKNMILKSNTFKKITVSRGGKPLEILLKTN